MKKRTLCPFGYHDSPIAGHVRYQSSYERKFMEYLDAKKYKWIRCKERFPYFDAEGKRHTYNPDFFLPDLNLYIEVKGMIRKNDPIKFENFPQDKDLVLLEYEELNALGIPNLFNPNTEKKLVPGQWPYKLLKQMPEFDEAGIISEELKKRLKKNVFKLERL